MSIRDLGSVRASTSSRPSIGLLGEAEVVQDIQTTTADNIRAAYGGATTNSIITQQYAPKATDLYRRH